MYRIQYLK